MNAKHSQIEKRGSKGGGLGYKVHLGGMDMVHNFTVNSGATSHKEAKGTYEKMCDPKGQGKSKKK